MSLLRGTMDGMERVGAYIDAIARSQHGLITTGQLSSLGVVKKARLTLVDQRQLVPLRRGIYRCAGVAPTWEAAVLAAVLSAGTAAVASHHSAARLWGLTAAEDAAAAIHLTAPGQHRLGGVVTHRRDLPPAARTVRHRVPVTTAARALLDVSDEPTMTKWAMGNLVDEALRRRLVRLADLSRLVLEQPCRGGPSYRLLRLALRDRSPGYSPGANDWERSMDEWWERSGLPAAERQYRVRIRGRTFIIDRAIVDLKVAVEWNGFGYHGDRTGFDRDADKQLALVSAQWIYLPVTTNTAPEAVCRAVAGAVAQRQGPRG